MSFIPAFYAGSMPTVWDGIPILLFRRMPSGFKICSDRFDRFDHFMQTVNMVNVVMSFFFIETWGLWDFQSLKISKSHIIFSNALFEN